MIADRETDTQVRLSLSSEAESTGPILNAAYTTPEGSADMPRRTQEANFWSQVRLLEDGSTMTHTQAGSDSQPDIFQCFSVTSNEAAIKRVTESWDTVFQTDLDFLFILKGRSEAEIETVRNKAREAGRASLGKALDEHERLGSSPFLVTATTYLVEGQCRRKNLCFGWNFTDTTGAQVDTMEDRFELPAPTARFRKKPKTVPVNRSKVSSSNRSNVSSNNRSNRTVINHAQKTLARNKRVPKA